MTDTQSDHLIDRQLLDQYYKGNKAKEAADRKKLRATVLQWSDLEAEVKVYPEHAQEAQQAIENRLGYRPPRNIIIPHEAFIRTVIEQQDKGMISATDYLRDMDTHIRHIRNDDMNKCGWVDKTRFTWAEIQHYNNYLPQFEAMAHARFTRFFGHLQSLDYLLPADMMLRELWLQHPDLIHKDLTPFDYKAFTIVAYRKIFIEQGKDAADQSGLLLSAPL